MDGLEIADFIGIIAFALSGFLVAVRDKLDLLGVFIAAFLTALGGGVLRDTIADRAPYTFTHVMPTMLVIIVIILSILFKIHQKTDLDKKFYFIISDSIGLVAFSIAGAFIGLMVEFNIFGVVMLGLVTAVGGGVMRDILLNKVPILLTSELYGSVSILVSIAIFIIDKVGMSNYTSVMSVFILGLSLRLVAYYKKWHLPKIG
ncbi:MAG: TRIC cation channel family protein [Sulfurospirillum sp.]|nr:TRIC cation channel family protein [Sulfurospirillum sp.]